MFLHTWFRVNPHSSVCLRIKWLDSNPVAVTDIPLCNDHHETRKSRMLTLEKLTAKEILLSKYLLNMLNFKPFSQIYFVHFLKNSTLTWNQINLFSLIATVNSYLQKQSPVGVLCEFCEISKNTFSYRIPPVAASVLALY